MSFYSVAHAQWPPAGKQEGRRSGCDSHGTSNAAASDGGCGVVGYGTASSLGNVMPWTRNRMIDAAYRREGLQLVQLFRVAPAEAFLDDRAGPNAYATPEQHFPNGPDGTVVFGVTLLERELRRDGGAGLSVPAIMAHEFGHVLQFKDPEARSMPTPVKELHTDCLAGWYLGQRRRLLPTDVRPALASFFEMGDYNFNDSQ